MWRQTLMVMVFLVAGWGSAQAGELFDAVQATAERSPDEALGSWVGERDGTTGWEAPDPGMMEIPTRELASIRAKGPGDGPASSDLPARIILWDENRPGSSLGIQGWSQGGACGGVQFNVVIAGGR